MKTKPVDIKFIKRYRSILARPNVLFFEVVHGAWIDWEPYVNIVNLKKFEDEKLYFFKVNTEDYLLNCKLRDIL